MLSAKVFLNIFKWCFNTTTKRKSFPLICNIWITNKCNFRCKFCYQDFNSPSKTLSDSLFKSVIDDLEEMGTIYLYISGGEPLLVENIEEKLKYVTKRIPYVHMVSNGFLLDKEVAEKLSKTGINEISISIDGMETTHNKYRGNEKAFANALRAIDNLKKYAPNIHINCSTMIAPWNIDDQMELMKLCDSLNVKQRLTAFEDFPVVIKNYISDFEITDEFLKKLKTFIKNYSLLHKDRFMKFIEVFFELKVNNIISDEFELFKEPCLVPSFYVNILEDGSVSPCHGIDKYNCNFKNDFNIDKRPLKEIIFSNGYKKLIKEMKSCSHCKELLSSCYIRPRLVFPLSSFFKYTVYPRIKDIFG